MPFRTPCDTTHAIERIEDVEKEVSLPPMRQETVLLDLDPYAVMTYNIMQATIVINAVDSERIGLVSDA